IMRSESVRTAGPTAAGILPRAAYFQAQSAAMQTVTPLSPNFLAGGQYTSCLSGKAYRCLTMRERSSRIMSMDRLSVEQQKRVVAALVEGNSIRATVRMTGVR